MPDGALGEAGAGGARSATTRDAPACLDRVGIFLRSPSPAVHSGMHLGRRLFPRLVGAAVALVTGTAWSAEPPPPARPSTLIDATLAELRVLAGQEGCQVFSSDA